MSMTERVRDAARAQPLQAFDVVLGDGRRFTIPHPDWVVFPPLTNPQEFQVFEADSRESTEFSSWWINENDVIGVVVTPIKTSPKN